uniref:Uncharacterized protein n=1 Tax=Rhizophora mucronata TaxID=61149 RepID=A0A2P2PSL9_RHIMU
MQDAVFLENSPCPVHQTEKDGGIRKSVILGSPRRKRAPHWVHWMLCLCVNRSKQQERRNSRE